MAEFHEAVVPKLGPENGPNLGGEFAIFDYFMESIFDYYMKLATVWFPQEYRGVEPAN